MNAASESIITALSSGHCPSHEDIARLPKAHSAAVGKNFVQMLLGLAIACFLSGCLFQEPVFIDGFSKIDPDLGGVWGMDGKNGDPRKMEFAVCAPIDSDRYMINHPTEDKDSIYYEARLLRIHNHSLLQLRVLATFGDGLPKADAKRYTLLWIEKDPKESTLRVRALGGDALKNKGPADVKVLLEGKSTDWNTLFGDSMVFRRLKEE